MAVSLELQAAEEGTYVVTAAFTDEDGDAATPTSITWSLFDDRGEVINSRSNVAVATPASSVNIVLTGDDLSIGSNGAYRQIVLSWVYDSDLGSDLVGRQVATFEIENIFGIT